MSNLQPRRVLMCLIGVLISGIDVCFFRLASLGLDPFQTLMTGLNAVIPISFGTLYLIANAVLLLFSIVFDRSKIGIATVINLTLLGYVAEYSEKTLRTFLPAPSLPLRFAILCFALVVGCFAAALYFNANLGVSTYDAVALVAAQRQKKVPFRFCRILADLTCVLLALLLLRLADTPWGQIVGTIGPATLITAFCMGPLISFFSTRLPDYTRA